MKRMTEIGDAAGVAASVLCTVHCLAAPLLLALLPSLFGGDTAHLVLLGVALLATLASLLPGFRAHRRLLVPALGAAGLACLAGGVFVAGPRWGAPAEACMSIAGAALLCSAHLRNRALCRRCRGHRPPRRA